MVKVLTLNNFIQINRTSSDKIESYIDYRTCASIWITSS